MSPQKVTINSRKFDESISRSWTCFLVEQKDNLLTLAGEFDQTVEHEDLGIIEKGTVSHEYFWLGRGYNIFRFQHPDGSLRNFYCNITMPPLFDGGVLDYIDLDIDVLVWPDFRYEILDRDEYEQNALRFCYPDKIIRQVEQNLHDLIEMIERREFPFSLS